MKKLLSLMLLVFLLVSCMPAPAIATQVVPTNTAIPTETLKPTITLRPSLTSSPIATHTAIATFTPATPSLNSQSYKLQEWSADKADLLIDEISSNLRAIANDPIYQSSYGQSSYMTQYQLLWVSEQEALLRFPNAPQATYWQWDSCYNLAVYYQGLLAEAPELQCYARLIENGLNLHQTNISYLLSWFTNHESRVSFAISSAPAPQGFAGSYIITLEDSAILWLLEKDGKFQVTGFLSSMFHYRESFMKFQLLDLTGDNFPELILYVSTAHCCGAFSIQYIYDLSSGTSKQLSFMNLNGVTPNVSSDYDSYITRLDPNVEQYPGLLFESHYNGGDPLTQPCNLRTYEKYYWSDNQFELVDTWYGIDKPSQYDLREDFCKFVLDTAKEQGEINVIVKTIGNTNLSQPDVQEDQVLYRLGEYHARLGDIEKARDFFTKTIVSQPTSNKSDQQWSRAAQVFLANYQTKTDYYAVCSRIPQCDVHRALQQLIAEIKPDSFLVAADLLKTSGVSVKSNGYVNFDGAGAIEQWLVVQHPNRPQREFWILVQDTTKLYGLFVENISTNKPELKEFQGSNNYGLLTKQGESLFSLERISFSGQPYILTHTIVQNNDPNIENDYLKTFLFDTPLDNISNQLLNGVDPKQIKEMLTQLNQSKTYNCKTSNRCDEVYYLLGLASELEGDEQGAVDAYLQLWKAYPDSLYTIMARSKLKLSP